MKKRIITISIISTILAILLLGIVVLCAVFRVGKIDVVKLGEDAILTTNADGSTVELTSDDVISASGIKRGRSTLFLDKDAAQANIEKAFPYIKVVQISLTGARTVEISVTARHEMFYYTTNNAGFFVLDEELKVLKIVTERPDNLVPISNRLSYLRNGTPDINENILSANTGTKAGDFLGNADYRQIFSNLYVAMYKTVLVNEDGSLWVNKLPDSDVDELLQANTIRYLGRADLHKVLSGIQFETGYTLSGSYNRLVLTTLIDGKQAVKVDVGMPELDLEYKINACFSMVSILDNDQLDGQPNEATTSAKGSVTYGYDEQGNSWVGYVAPAAQGE